MPNYPLSLFITDAQTKLTSTVYNKCINMTLNVYTVKNSTFKTYWNKADTKQIWP